MSRHLLLLYYAFIHFFFYNDRNIKMVRKYVALRVKRKTETENETNGPIC